MRIGLGFDTHAFAAERALILGGVHIPYERGLMGHSDADVLAHAVSDALLGAARLGDIGQHFPDNDPAYRGADSLALLAACMKMVRQQGWELENVDAVLIAQAPKLAPYRLQMQQNMARAMDVEEQRVSVKATTTERLGFCGRAEGIAAQAVCLLKRKE